MKIDLTKINQNEFRVSERIHDELGTVILINPGFDKHKWNNDELHLRSLLCRPDGLVLSSGFLKFKNYQEDPELDVVTNEAISKGDIIFTEKLDGSLIIRFVVNDKVYFRTRGSHELGEGFKEPVMNLVETKYPKLLDPKLPSDFAWDILMEYTGPENKIILDYAEPDLCLLGAMRRLESYREPFPVFFGTPQFLNDLSKVLSVPSVPVYSGLGSTDKEIIQTVFNWQDKEGIVLRCLNKENGVCGHLVKIKSDVYRRLHALKYQMTTEKLNYICWIKELDSAGKFTQELYKLGLDFESVNILLPKFHDYETHKHKIDCIFDNLVSTIDASGVTQLESRKDKALKLKELTRDYPELFGAAMQYALGNNDAFQNYKDAQILDISPNYVKMARVKAKEFTNSLSQPTEREPSELAKNVTEAFQSAAADAVAISLERGHAVVGTIDGVWTKLSKDGSENI